MPRNYNFWIFVVILVLVNISEIWNFSEFLRKWNSHSLCEHWESRAFYGYFDCRFWQQ